MVNYGYEHVLAMEREASKPEPRHHLNCPSNSKTHKEQAKQGSTTFLAFHVVFGRAMVVTGNPEIRAIGHSAKQAWATGRRREILEYKPSSPI